MRRNLLKNDCDRATKISISMPRILLDQAALRARQRRITKFSGYVQRLIERDLGIDQTANGF